MTLAEDFYALDMTTNPASRALAERHLEDGNVTGTLAAALVTLIDAYEHAHYRTQLRAALSEVYTPDGVEIWMAARNRRFGGLTVEQMELRGRSDEVLFEARSLAGMVAT